jgi:hypothetical protein
MEINRNQQKTIETTWKSYENQWAAMEPNENQQKTNRKPMGTT